MNLQTLGRRVKRRREDLNETTEEVASYAMLSLPVYLNLESGTYEPSAEVLKALASQLSVSLAYLEGEGEDI